MRALFTDLYQLTMAAGYWMSGKSGEIATFEMFVRRLPARRDYLVVAGVEQAVRYLTELRFTEEELNYLKGLGQFAAAPSGFWDYLKGFRFTGDVDCVAEGTVLFAGEPVMQVRAPLIEGQIPETYLLSTIGFQTLIASKASRIVAAAAGRDVVEFGCRRAHTPEAGSLGGRAAYLAGCTGTSNVEAGMRYGVPVFGTAAHSWVLSFEQEREAFLRLQQLLGPRTVQLIDTYDTVEGARTAAALGQPLWGVRLDSGDLDVLSRQVRAVLDETGLHSVKIMATNDLDEDSIARLVAAGAPIDVYGVGTSLATSFDAPALSNVYKLVEVAGRPAAKRSEGKQTLPGAKQLYRYDDRDVVGLEGETHAGATPLLRPIVRGGVDVGARPGLAEARAYAQDQVAKFGKAGRKVEISASLRELAASKKV